MRITAQTRATSDTFTINLSLGPPTLFLDGKRERLSCGETTALRRQCERVSTFVRLGGRQGRRTIAAVGQIATTSAYRRP